MLKAVTFANAQITLEHTFSKGVRLFSEVEHGYGNQIGQLPSQYFFNFAKEGENFNINLFDYSNYSLYKTITIPDEGYDELDLKVLHITQNIFTTDNKIAVMVLFRKIHNNPSINNVKRAKQESHHIDVVVIFNEDGEKIFSAEKEIVESAMPYIIQVNQAFKLIIDTGDMWNNNYSTEIYSLPGNGETVNIETPVAPRKSSARKYLHNDQVLIDSSDHTYTLTGQEVR